MSDDRISPIRLCEWGHIAVHGLTLEERRSVAAAVDAWQGLNKLPVAPLSFGGTDGARLTAKQYVGVVEVNGIAIEIYPKLDAAFLQANDRQSASTSAGISTVMDNLLWMLQVAEHRLLAEAQTAHLGETTTSFIDLFAYLLARNLLPELQRGVSHSYVTFEDDLKMVRGRVNVVDQVTRKFNRFDRMSCTWDEFTPNTAVNRLFKCACRFLSERVGYPEAARLLIDCEGLLGEVDSVSPTTALSDVWNLRFDRSMVRFRTAFDLAKRLVAGMGHNLGVGNANTFVFLLDMNKVFESYVHAVLEARFKTRVEKQKIVGRLFDIDPGGVRQFADYYWRDDGSIWIGDAKYKHLAGDQGPALRFVELEEEEGQPGEGVSLASQVLSADDIRQLTVYAELVRLNGKMEQPPNLLLLYPFVGDATECVANKAPAWNGSSFWLMPVQVKPQDFVGDAIQWPGDETGT